MRALGVNAIFHDPAAALVIDGGCVAAAEEERFSRRKHGKRPVPFSAWETPDLSARWCLDSAGLRAEQLDVVAYSFDPALHRPAADLGLDDPWDHLRLLYAQQAPGFLAEALPGLQPDQVRFVPHHVAHAASAGLAAPFAGECAVLVLDGRGEAHSHLAGMYTGGRLDVVAAQALPHSLGLLYEDATAHLGFLRSSDEFKVMALASYGKPRHLEALRERVHHTGDGGFTTTGVDWSALAPARLPDEDWTRDHADLAASLQAVVEETLLDLARWLRRETGARSLAMAGGVALNCVANTRIHAEAGFEQVWVQPAAGDAGTALGAALAVTADSGMLTTPMPGAALGRGFDDAAVEQALIVARVPYERPADLADAVAEVLADDGIVAWFQGRSEYGPRALGHRSLLAHPGRRDMLVRLNDVKGREQFRPVAPMVLAERAAGIFERGPLPSPYMLFVHDVRPEWRERIAAVVHVDDTARVQTVEAADEPLLAAMLTAFERRTGLPVVVNTSLNTAGRPMVDDLKDALELFGSTPVDLLAIGPFVLRRPAPMTFSIVVPTVGRPSLTHLLHALARTSGPLPERIVLVDDRPGEPGTPLPLTGITGWPAARLTTLRSGGRGPAAARNTGWRAATGEWVVFLDDDVLVTATWLTDLADDLGAASPSTGGVQGRISVPLPADRRATDWERGTAGLEDARWITADMAYRRAVLVEVGGFDERFPRAFREDADLALRVSARHRLVQGRRRTLHPVRPAPWHASVGQQRGNADDVLMRRLHGPDWYRRAEASVGRRPLHLLTTALAAVGVVASMSRRHRRLGAMAAGGWLALTAQFAFLRIRSGPWRPGEVARMAVTSVLIPLAASGHFVAGLLRHRRPAPWPGGEHDAAGPATTIAAVLVDRDDTLVHDVPYNTDPELVRPIDGVAEALDRLRAAGVPVAVVSNQSGVARGLIDAAQLDAVNARIEAELGPFADWQVCPHGEAEGCDCRKPAPGLLLAAARRLGVPISRCAMIGDIGADVAAGTAAGVAVSILVPTGATRPEEVSAAGHTAASFAAAVDLLFREFALGTAVPTDEHRVSARSSGARP